MNRYVACTAYCQILSTFSHIELVHVWFKRIYFKFINIHGVKNTYQKRNHMAYRVIRNKYRLNQ